MPEQNDGWLIVKKSEWMAFDGVGWTKDRGEIKLSSEIDAWKLIKEHGLVDAVPSRLNITGC